MTLEQGLQATTFQRDQPDTSSESQPIHTPTSATQSFTIIVNLKTNFNKQIEQNIYSKEKKNILEIILKKKHTDEKNLQSLQISKTDFILIL